MNFRKLDTIGFIAMKNLQAASIFNYYGIDYYSRGYRTLEAACIEENAPMVSLMEELFALREDQPGVPNFLTMDMIALSTYILRTHHKFTEKKLVFIKKTMERLIRNCGDTEHITRLRKKFDELSLYLTVHMKHEEFIIFPSITRMVRTTRVYSSLQQTIQNPISAMIHDHDYEVQTLRRLAELTGHYTVPANADYALKVTYEAMKELEEDLKIHMHLENNILFPRALDFSATAGNSLN